MVGAEYRARGCGWLISEIGRILAPFMLTLHAKARLVDEIGDLWVFECGDVC